MAITNGVWRLKKKFSCAIGHRLSGHSGLCKNLHGHNFVFIVALKSSELNIDGMVMDFSNFKKLVNKHLEKLDHGLLLNKYDPKISELTDVECSEKITLMSGDPTAEKLAEYLYNEIDDDLPSNIHMDYVEVYENDNSSVTYSEDIVG